MRTSNHYNHFFTDNECGELFQLLLDTTSWRKEEIPFPGTTAWYGKSVPWTEPLLDIRNYIEDRLEIKFNAALLNLYRDEINSMIAVNLFYGDRRYSFEDKPVTLCFYSSPASHYYPFRCLL